mmetsp:Transcript_15216/g.37395  ORF Transcript_15216/g.37395 Transcript_15216/m.37395 type:complete len:217 (+) Transcript_15216:148-798(+)
MSSIMVNWLKMSTLCPPARSRGSISSSAASLPEDATSASTRLPPCRAVAAAAISSPNKKGWQHTLRSCMSRLLNLVNLPPFPGSSGAPPTLPSSPATVRSLCSAMHRPASSDAFSDVALEVARRPNRPFSPSSSVLYHSRCASDSGMRTTVSVFGGRSLDSTAALVRRSMSGCSSVRAAATAVSSPNAASPSASIFSAPVASSTSWKSTDTSARSS